ncbi:MAG: hypothetical protein ACTHQ3_13555 [Motilibacteraceae bacterium]
MTDETCGESCDQIPDEVARALRDAVAVAPPTPSARLAAFLADPGEQPLRLPSAVAPMSRPRTIRRSSPMTRLLAALAKAGFGAKIAAALATGGVVALAGVGTISAASDHSVATAVRPADDVDSPEPSETAEPTGSDEPTDPAKPSETPKPSESAEAGESAEAAASTASSVPSPTDTATGSAAAITPNPVAAANHHDGRGSDDQKADVHAGGPVDHRAEHSPAPRSTATATATATASATPTSTGMPTVVTARG